MPELLVLRPLLVGKWVRTFFAVPSIKRLTDILGPRWEGSFSIRNWLSVSRILSTGIWQVSLWVLHYHPADVK